MALKFESAGSQVIMDYIISSSSVPLTGSRNRDGSPFIGEFTMKVSEFLSASFRNVGVEVECITGSDDDYPSFIGTIISSGRDEQNKAFDLVIRNKLAILEIFPVASSHLGFVGGTAQQYQASDNELWPSVQALYVLEKIFEIPLAGKFAVETGYADIVLDTINVGGTNRDMKYQHLRLDENMLFAINTGIAGNDDVTSDDAYVNNRPSQWDFVREYCTYTNSKIELSTTGTKREYILKQIDDGSDPGISDADIYWKTTKRILGESGGYNTDHRFNDSRGSYSGSTGSDLTSHVFSSGNKKNNIAITNNFVFMWEAYWDSAGDTLGLGNYPEHNWSADQMVKNRRDKRITSWLRTTIKTAVGFNGTARINEIQVAQQQNKIIHEVLN